MAITMSKLDTDALVEEVANLEHEQWIAWSKDIAEKESLSEERVNRWKQYWVPYGELTDDVKEHDRVWARKVIKTIRGNDV